MFINAEEVTSCRLLAFVVRGSYRTGRRTDVKCRDIGVTLTVIFSYIVGPCGTNGIFGKPQDMTNIWQAKAFHP